MCHSTYKITHHIIEVVDGGGRGSIEGAYITPLTAGAVHIRFLHFISAHYISAFNPVKDKK